MASCFLRTLVKISDVRRTGKEDWHAQGYCMNTCAKFAPKSLLTCNSSSGETLSPVVPKVCFLQVWRSSCNRHTTGTGGWHARAGHDVPFPEATCLGSPAQPHLQQALHQHPC